MEKKYITISDFFKKYGYVVSSTEFYRRKKNINIKPVEKKYYDEDLLIKTFELSGYTNEYKKISDLSKLYGINQPTIVSYAIGTDYSKYFLKILNKYYLNENIFKNEMLPLIQRNINRTKKMTTEEYNKLFDDKMGSEYQRLEDIINTKKKIKVLHIPCGNIVLMNPNNSIYKGSGCPHCANNQKYTHDELSKKIFENTNGVYSLVNSDHYISNKKGYITVKHNSENCKGKQYNNEFNTRVDLLLRGQKKCPYCSMSNGELSVLQYLKDNKIEYKMEQVITYNDITYRFDFYLEKYKLFIEYDGIQHFQNTEYFEDVEKRIAYDRQKDEYISKSEFKLVRISYNNIHKIKEILDNIFIKNKFNDYPIGKYSQVIGNIVYPNVIYIG